MSMPETKTRKSLDEIRVFAPSRGNLAVKTERLPETRVADPARAPKPRLVKPREKKRGEALRAYLKNAKLITKAAVFMAVFAAAAAMIIYLSGYNSIAETQKQIVRLQKNVDELRLSVDSDRTLFLSAINMTAAEEAAADNGMIHPASDNFGH